MRIQFKFHEQADDEQRRRVLERLDRDADQVERLFPADDDPELATQYVAHLQDESASKALAMLKRSKVVQFAEPQAERRLHLPEELKRNGTITRTD